jgi:hypothetical protein
MILAKIATKHIKSELLVVFLTMFNRFWLRSSMNSLEAKSKYENNKKFAKNLQKHDLKMIPQIRFYILVTWAHNCH